MLWLWLSKYTKESLNHPNILKSHWIVHLKWVNCIPCELHLTKAIKKRNPSPKPHTMGWEKTMTACFQFYLVWIFLIGVKIFYLWLMRGNHPSQHLQSYTHALLIWFCCVSVKWIPFMLWQTLEHPHWKSAYYYCYSEVSKLLRQMASNCPVWLQDVIALVNWFNIK